jgi:hypothetical protein
LAAFRHCDNVLAASDIADIRAYDLLVSRPIATRVNGHRGVRLYCRKALNAPAPEGLAPGSPFGPVVTALILHLPITQAGGFEVLLSATPVFRVIADTRATAVMTEFLKGRRPET